MKRLIMSIVSLYTSFAFLVASRFLYNMEAPTITKMQAGDFHLWMGHTPFAIKCAILIPLVISIILIIPIIKKNNKAIKARIKEEFPE